jgi:hypothetical protein
MNWMAIGDPKQLLDMLVNQSLEKLDQDLYGQLASYVYLWCMSKGEETAYPAG